MSKINQNWIFGAGAGLSFTDPNNPAPISSNLPAFSTAHNEGCASISDSNGNLLFYTNGVRVWRVDYNNNNNHVDIGVQLKGNNSSTQSAILIPDPAGGGKYYIFTADDVSGSDHVAAYLLDTNGSWSCQEITNIYSNALQTNNLYYTHTEKITAVQNPDCTKFWVITVVEKKQKINPQDPSEVIGGFFRVWLVDSSGILFSNETSMQIAQPARGGYLKGSPSGQMLANANGNHVVVYAFDNSTGSITVPGRETQPHINPQGISDMGVYGVEFSPNSEHLFYGNLDRISGTVNKGRIFYVDLDPNNIPPLARTQVGGDIDNDTANFSTGQGGNYVIGALQLAVDGKIYFAKDRVRELGRIENPDTVLVNASDIVVTHTALTWLPDDGGPCRLGLPNLLPNPCKEEGPCDCGCTGCNENAEEQNEELIERAKTKFNVIKSKNSCSDPFTQDCTTIIQPKILELLEPCFYFHWGDGANDQIEEHDTEVFYITVCNRLNDIQYNGFRITKITLIPDKPISKIQIVPDRFINLDCLEPCTCQTREFAIITRANDTADTYTMEVEYCFESIEITSKPKEGKAEFEFQITED